MRNGEMRARWIGWRNRALADPGFQRFAAHFPLTRFVARRRARALFDLVAGFTYSQTLYACVQTGLLAVLADGPQSTAQVAARIDLPLAGTERLLKAAAALKLVEAVGERWMLGSDGAAFRGNSGIAEMVTHHAMLYADLADPVALLRRGGGGGALSAFWTYAEATGTGRDDQVAAYSRLMAASQPLVAEQVTHAYRFASHRHLLDIGGGEGRFLTAVAAQAPRLAIALFDLPAVGARAHAALEAAGLGARTTIHGGDFLRDPLPEGHDIITLVRILHDHDDPAVMTLLRAVHRALPPGGRLLIAEPMSGTRGAEPVGDAYFGLYLLAMGSGRPRTVREIRTMLGEAGFGSSRTVATALPLSANIIVATR